MRVTSVNIQNHEGRGPKMKHTFLLAMTAVLHLLTLVAAKPTTPQERDSAAAHSRMFDVVPAGSWVYRGLYGAQSAMPKRRGLPGYPKGFGSASLVKPVLTRYEFAVAVKRVRDELASPHKQFRHEASVRRLIARLSREFGPELLALGK